MTAVTEFGAILNVDNARIIAKYFRQAKVDFSQHSFSIDDVWINDYKTLEAQLVNCKINNVIQFFDQVNANLFKKKQKVESSALGLLKTLLSEVINEKAIKATCVKSSKVKYATRC